MFKKIFFSLSLFIFLGTGFTLPVVAVGTVENTLLGDNTETNRALKNQGYTTSSKLRNPIAIAQKIIYVIEGLLGIILVILLTYGGFIWMTAAGDSKKSDAATHLIYQAVIGLIIVLSAWLLTYFIIDQIGKAVSG